MGCGMLNRWCRMSSPRNLVLDSFIIQEVVGRMRRMLCCKGTAESHPPLLSQKVLNDES